MSVAMIGRTLSHYEIEGRLGEGGMGVVYLARDTRLERRVAIKVLSPSALGDPELTGRLRREARAASQLNHPNIVTVHEIGNADGFDFIIMERVEGRPLSAEIAAGGLPIARVLDLAGQIAGALAAAHAAQIIHRDVKPANVIVRPDGRAKVLDFGLAKSTAPPDESSRTRSPATAGVTQTGLLVGTAGYMSPEQIEGRAADARSDVYAFGVVMFEMLTGRRPFAAGTEWAEITGTVKGNAPAVSSLRPDTPAALTRIVARCLAIRPEDRFASATEVAAELARIGSVVATPARRSRVAAAAVVALAVVAVAVVIWFVRREAQLRWARVTAIAEIAQRTAKSDLVGAYLIGRRALAIAPDDPEVRQAWQNFTLGSSLISSPPGALVSIRSYLLPGGPWVPLATTPGRDVVMPFGLLRWRVTKPGFDTLEVGRNSLSADFHLVPAGRTRAGMVYVPAGAFDLESTLGQVELPEYWLDRCEVTNRQYRAFVDSGGYRRREFWKIPFVKEGRTLGWDAAMREFCDATGRPGPSTWELGACPEGQDDYPVGGVSWYEAAAYAAFAGKQLPTAYHWYKASGAFDVFSEILVTSNFAGKGPVRVASGQNLGPYGALDMAGNVKEWCWNATSGNRRYILGGGWNEADYMFHDEDAQSPFERRATFGFRCMSQDEPLSPRLTAAIRTFERDPASLKPVSDDLYRAYLPLYNYDRQPLDVRQISRSDGNPAWREERVSVRAAYGNERLPIQLYVPKSVRPPYQAVVFFPGSGAVMTRSSRDLRLTLVEFLARSGRMLVYPIYQGTYERHEARPYGPNEIRDVTIDRGKDIRRTIDYLDSRPDIDTTKISFYGLSLGAQMGPLFLAIEPRFRTGVLFSGGFETWEMAPECDPVNFAPRVHQPVLMVNGREDFDLPYTTAQLPLFRMLGSAATDKQHVVFEGGHIPPNPQEAIKVILDWLDQRVGPVN